MADITLAKPQAGERNEIPSAPDARLLFQFNPNDALMDRQGNDLIFTFEDGGVVALKDFYESYTKESLPDFVVDGSVITGETFFAALSEELQPAAGPAATTTLGRGGRFSDDANSDLLGGIDRLGGLDQSSGGDTQPQDAFSPLTSGGLVEQPNTAPVFTDPAGEYVLNVAESGVLPGGNTVTAGVPHAAGTLNAMDAQGDPIRFFLVDAEGNQVQSITTPYGTLTLNDDGTFAFTLDNTSSATNTLTPGDLVNLHFTVGVMDVRGAVSGETRDITVNIAGSNDRPTLESITVGGQAQPVAYDPASDSYTVALPNVVESGGAVQGGQWNPIGGAGAGTAANGEHVMNGSFSFNDPDADGQAGTLTQGAASMAKNFADAGNVIGQGLFDFVITGHTVTPDGQGGFTHTYDYTFQVNDAALEFLAAGDTVTLTWPVTHTDQWGATRTVNVVVTVQGTNDAPVFQIKPEYTDLVVKESGVGVESVNADGTANAATGAAANAGYGGKLQVEGDLSATDADRDNLGGAGLKYYIVDASGNHVNTLNLGYGVLTLDADTGHYTFTLNDGAANTLAHNELATQGFTVVAVDNHGATDTTNLNFNIRGTNDLPEISGITARDAQGNETALVANAKGLYTHPDHIKEAGEGVPGQTPEAPHYVLSGHVTMDDVDSDDDATTLRFGVGLGDASPTGAWNTPRVRRAALWKPRASSASSC